MNIMTISTGSTTSDEICPDLTIVAFSLQIFMMAYRDDPPNYWDCAYLQQEGPVTKYHNTYIPVALAPASYSFAPVQAYRWQTVSSAECAAVQLPRAPSSLRGILLFVGILAVSIALVITLTVLTVNHLAGKHVCFESCYWMSAYCTCHSWLQVLILSFYSDE